MLINHNFEEKLSKLADTVNKLRDSNVSTPQQRSTSNTPLQNSTSKVLFLTMPGTYHRFQHSDNSKTINQQCINNVLIETNH